MSDTGYEQLFDEFSDDNETTPTPSTTTQPTVTPTPPSTSTPQTTAIVIDELFDISDDEEPTTAPSQPPQQVQPQVSEKGIEGIALGESMEDIPVELSMVQRQANQHPLGAPQTINTRRFPEFSPEDDIILFSLPKLVGSDIDEYIRHIFNPSHVCQTLDPLRTEATGGIDGIIRYRTVTLPDGTTQRQSNSRLVRWNNGQMHLQVGRKYYEVRPVRVNDSSDFLFVQAENGMHYHIGSFTQRCRVSSQKKDFTNDAIRLQVVQQRLKDRTQALKAAGGNVRRIRQEGHHQPQMMMRDDDDDDGEDPY